MIWLTDNVPHEVLEKAVKLNRALGRKKISEELSEAPGDCPVCNGEAQASANQRFVNSIGGDTTGRWGRG